MTFTKYAKGFYKAHKAKPNRRKPSEGKEELASTHLYYSFVDENNRCHAVVRFESVKVDLYNTLEGWLSFSGAVVMCG